MLAGFSIPEPNENLAKIAKVGQKRKFQKLVDSTSTLSAATSLAGGVANALNPFKEHPIMKIARKMARGGGENEVSDEHKFYGFFAESAYQDDSEEFLRDNLENFDYVRDEELSNEEHETWVNEERKHVISTIRGTKVLSDLAPDMHIMLGKGKESTRYKRERKLFQSSLDKYGEGWSHDVTGHSLGGYIAQGLGTEFNDEISNAYAFNPGSSPLQTRLNPARARMKKPVKQDNSHIHTIWVDGDPISVFGRDKTHNVTVYDQAEGVSNPHTICNITKTCVEDYSDLFD